jgi:drug/metabolite transporter (DMT)-like permease
LSLKESAVEEIIMTKQENSMLPYLIGMVIAMLIWGISWTVGKVAVEHSNPQISAFWRYAISFLAIVPIVWWRKSPMKTDTKGALLTLLAGILTAGFNYLFFLGLAHGQAGYGGTMVTALVPVFTYIISILFLGVAVSLKQVVALLIGIAGVVILLRIPWEGLGFLNLDSFYFLEAAVLWSVVTVIAHKASVRIDSFFYTLIVFAITAIIDLFFALPYHPFSFTSYDMTFWYAIIFMGVLPGVSTALFFLSAGKIGAHKTGAFMFLVPVGAIVSSWVVYREHIALSTIVGAGLAFVTVILFNATRGKKTA